MSASSPSTASVAPPSLLARVVGVLADPRSTFTAICERPRWASVLVLTMVVVGSTSMAFLATPVGRQALVDQRVDLLEGFGQLVDDERYAALQRDVHSVIAQQVTLLLGGIPLAAVVLSGALWTTLGHDGTTFTQTLAVVAHSGAILMVRAIVLTPWNYMRESFSSPLNLGALFSGLNEGSFVASLLGTVDFFAVWWAATLAIGLSVLYRLRWRSAAVALFSAYGLLAAVLAGARSALTIQ